MAETNRKQSGCGPVIAVIGILLCFALLLDQPCRVPKGAKEAECKQNLHAIRLGLERYAVDHGGFYPQYLIGGTFAEDETGAGNADYSSDALQREGYLPMYPKNPFCIGDKRLALLDLQTSLSSSHTGDDLMRPGNPDGDLMGYRFGNDGRHMGQLLCDSRWEHWTSFDPTTEESEPRKTGVDIEYRMWDTWNARKRSHGKEYLEGQFFYKTGLAVNNDHQANPSSNPNVDQYILGVYGYVRTKGMDVLGEVNNEISSNALREPYLNQLKSLRSEYSPNGIEGCPFRFDQQSLNTEIQRLSYGNPNGIPDGVVLVLTNGV